MTDDRIPTNPLDEGDTFAIDLQRLDDTTERVTIDVPIGKGMALAYWLNRQFTETPQARQERIEQDTLTALKAGVAA